jgi:hypothetical protein
MANILNLKPTRRRINHVYRRAYLWSARVRGERIVHLLHIGKTGGNAIRHALELRKEKPRTLNNGWIVMQRAHDVSLDMCPKGDAVVLVVRHPIPRFISAFWSRYRRAQTDPGALTSGEVAAFEEFGTPEQLAIALSDHDPDVSNSAHHAMNTIEHIRNTLVFYLSSPEYLRSRENDVLHVGFQERLNEDFAAITQRLGISTNVNLPTDQQRAHRTPEHFARNISETARVNLEWWFAEDLRLYATCREMAGFPNDSDHPPPP